MRLDHPNIIKVHDLIEDEVKIYLIIDLIKGPSLFEHTLNNKQLGGSHTAVIIAQILSVICYLHKQNLIMRKITMDSLFLVEPNTVNDIKILDLFFCCSVDGLEFEDPWFFEKIFEPSGMYIGEHVYQEKFHYEMSAPEMLPQESFLTDAKRKYSKPVDMWTLGCIAFNLACGFPPFERQEEFTNLSLDIKE